VEPYCPCILNAEHRVFLTPTTTGVSFNWLYLCSAEVNDNGDYSIGPLNLPDLVKDSLQEMTSALRELL
jgi:hypothetical protein